MGCAASRQGIGPEGSTERSSRRWRGTRQAPRLYNGVPGQVMLGRHPGGRPATALPALWWLCLS